MRSQLKRGCRVDIYQSPLAAMDFEGTAVLQSRIRKNYTSAPAYETWMVKFDEDDEPVERVIRVDLPEPSSGMLSSLARSPEGKSLLSFMRVTELSHDWSNPNRRGITAHFSGQLLDNEVGPIELTSTGRINDELLVHLEHRDTRIIVNLNTLLALASGYIRQQYDVATEAVQEERKAGGSD